MSRCSCSNKGIQSFASGRGTVYGETRITTATACIAFGKSKNLTYETQCKLPMYVYIKFTELLAMIAVVKSTILVLCMDAFMIRTLKNDLYSRDVLVNFSGNGVWDSQKLRLVRILRSTVMVRVGGGWEPLEEFLYDT